MSTFQGLPAHVLLVHFIVVLVPLTATLSILCVLWPALRRRLIWLVAFLAAAIAVLTPLTTEAGEWLEHRIQPTGALQAHTALGDTMVYFALGLILSSALLVFVHLREHRQRPLSIVATLAIGAVILTTSVAAVVQVYRIGDSGARSAWSEQAN